MARIVAHDRLPLLLGHLVNTHVEALGQRDLMLGFVELLLSSLCGLPIRKVPGGIQANFIPSLFVMMSRVSVDVEASSVVVA